MSDEHDESARQSREVEHEAYLERATAIDQLETFLEAFREDDPITMEIGDESVTFDPPAHLELEIEYEADGDERELEFELEWHAGGDGLDVTASEEGVEE